MNARLAGPSASGPMLVLFLLIGLFTGCGDDETTKPEDTTRTLSVSSQNPDQGVAVTCSFSGIDTTMITPFSLAFSSAASVTLEAPNLTAGNAFGHWLRDGQVGPSTLSMAISMDGNHSVTAVYKTLHDVMINSSPPGCQIEVDPPDFHGNGDGSTPFVLYYETGANIQVTAPEWSDDWRFTHWERDGTYMTASRIAVLTVNEDHSLTAVFEEVSEVPLAVSVANGLQLTVEVDPPDLHGTSFHATPFTFYFRAGTNITVTAPQDAEIYPGVYGDFVRWRTSEGPEGNRELALTMNQARNITAVYPEYREFTVPDLDNCESNAVVPVRIGGDGEFAGHGPDVWANVRFANSVAASELEVKVYFHLKETTSDWTEGEITKVVHRDVYGTSYTFQRMVSTGCDWYYQDTDGYEDSSNDHGDFSCDDPAENGAVEEFRAKGDTAGADIGCDGCTCSYLKVYWSGPIKYVVVPVD